MKIYVPDHGHVDRRKYCVDHGIGMLYAPHRHNLPLVDDFIVENGACQAARLGESLDIEKFQKFLDKCLDRGEPKVVPIPDIFKGGRKSYEFSVKHIDAIPDGAPRYFVVNPFITEQDLLPYFDLIDGLFLSMAAFSLPSKVSEYVAIAHRHKKKVHFGMVGPTGYSKAAILGADSCDGSTPMRHDELERIETWRKQAREQMDLSGIRDRRLVHYIEKEDLMLSIEHAQYADSHKQKKPEEPQS